MSEIFNCSFRRNSLKKEQRNGTVRWRLTRAFERRARRGHRRSDALYRPIYEVTFDMEESK